MSVLLRALGAQAAYALVQSLSPGMARVASLLLLLVANAFPLAALLSGQWAPGDVLIAFWLENVAIGLWAAVRILTAWCGEAPGRGGSLFSQLIQASAPSADPRTGAVLALVIRVILVGFFAVHYGLFTIVHGSFTFRLADDAGTTGSAGGFALMLLALVASHGLSTAIHWFGRGERHRVGPTQVMRQVYPRVFLMHLSVLGTGWLLVGGGNRGLPGALAGLAPGLLLIVIKVVVDVVSHVREHALIVTGLAPAPAGPAPAGPAPAGPAARGPVV